MKEYLRVEWFTRLLPGIDLPAIFVPVLTCGHGCEDEKNEIADAKLARTSAPAWECRDPGGAGKHRKGEGRHSSTTDPI